jgi:hypothetical protein
MLKPTQVDHTTFNYYLHGFSKTSSLIKEQFSIDISDKNKIDKSGFFAVVLIDTYICEICFKYLLGKEEKLSRLEKRKKSWWHTHCLFRLYDEIDTQTKDVIIMCCGMKKVDFEQQLKNASCYFERVRYFFIRSERVDNIRFNYSFISLLSTVLSDLIKKQIL